MGSLPGWSVATIHVTTTSLTPIPTTSKIDNTSSCTRRTSRAQEQGFGLVAQSTEWRNNGNHLVVCMDANENVYKKSIGEALTDVDGLVWATPDVQVVGACVMSCGFGVGDHRLFEVDIKTESLVGAKPPSGNVVDSSLGKIKKRQVYHSILRFHEGKIKNIANLKRAGRRCGMKNALRIAEELVSRIKRNAKAEKQILEIIEREKQSAFWWQLNYAMRKKGGGSIRSIQIQTDEGQITEYTSQNKVEEAIWSESSNLSRSPNCGGLPTSLPIDINRKELQRGGEDAIPPLDPSPRAAGTSLLLPAIDIDGIEHMPRQWEVTFTARGNEATECCYISFGSLVFLIRIKKEMRHREGRVDVLEKSIDLLDDWLIEQGTDEELRAKFQRMARSQDEIGWRQFMEGMVSKKILNVHYSTSNDSEEDMPVPSLQMKALATAKKEELQKAIDDELELGGEGLAEEDLYLLEINLDDLVTMSGEDQTSWLMAIRAARVRRTLQQATATEAI
ncbi:hypothetical protein ACHAWO_000595 [Cyclotella atomus]|uniref:Uncharacterized protein n=1 Tax=Cyclotella atomus TaxID=382360 RepID=A0ABD3NM04_9STRA